MATTIAVSQQTKGLLNQLGSKGQTYNEILLNLIKLARRQMFYEKQGRILRSEEFVSLDKV